MGQTMKLNLGCGDTPMAAVTIITPTWRRTATGELARCIASANNQTRHDWQHLVMSDGPYDPDTAELCLPDARRRYSALGRHAGDWGHTIRQHLLCVVTTPYVCFLDDDDEYLPDYLATMIAPLEADPSLGFTICPMRRLFRGGEILPGALTVDYIGTPQVLARTALLREVGWQVQHGYNADGHTYVALAAKTQWARIPEALINAY